MTTRSLPTNAKTPTGMADAVMMQIWAEWFAFYKRHFRAEGIAISMADQRAFYEIAQPLLHNLAADLQSKKARKRRS